MRILFVTQLLPCPLDAGPKVRAHFVLRYLAEAGHEVHLVSFVRPGDTPAHLEASRRLCSAMDTVPLTRSRLRDLRDGARSLVSGRPFLVLRDDLPDMRRRLARLTTSRSFDALHADQLWMAPYGMAIAGGVGMTVLDQHNAVFQVPARMAGSHGNPLIRAALRGEAGRLAAFEREACRRFDRVAWVTEEDRRAVLGDEDRGGRDIVIPIAIDPRLRPRVDRRRPFRVTFLGGLHWPPNREGAAWFLRHVWPRVARDVPGAVFTVLGRDGARALPDASGYPRVQVAGYVDDPTAYLTETAVFVVPLLSGAGMRVKILDAWCWGMPMVSTTIGAEGLRASDGDNVLVADDAPAFAEAVIRLFGDSHVASSLGEHGRATAERWYDWRTVYTAWDAIYGARRLAPPGPDRDDTEAGHPTPARMVR